MIPALALVLADHVREGRKAILIVGTIQDQQDYFLAVAQALGPLRARGAVTVLVAEIGQQNGRDWKRARYDVCEVDDSAGRFAWAGTLAAEAAMRCTPTKGKPKRLPRELKIAIRRGRRPKGAGLEG